MREIFSTSTQRHRGAELVVELDADDTYCASTSRQRHAAGSKSATSCFVFGTLAAAVLLGTATSADAQPRFRIAVNGGQQVTSTSFSEEQTFDQYFEQGSFKFERTIPSRVFYDGGVAIRLWRSLHAGLSVSFLDDKGAATVTSQVPHPLQFNQARTVTGEVQNVRRREIAEHIQASWTMPAAGGLELTFFGGPTIFITEQILMTKLEVALDKEVYPLDTLSFPGATTEMLKENAIGYNAGVDLSWRLSRAVGLGILIRYANAKKDFTPTGGKSVEIETGGLHAGGGLRLVF